MEGNGQVKPPMYLNGPLYCHWIPMECQKPIRGIILWDDLQELAVQFYFG